MNRREFTQILAIASAANLFPRTAFSTAKPEEMYNLANFGNARLLHMTDSHAQLLPVYFREPSVNIGINQESGKPPHIVGDNFLDFFNIAAGTIQAHAFTPLQFTKYAHKYGKVGGYAYLSTLVKQLRQSYGGDSRTLLLDGGDTWQGSATAYWTRGKDMVEASNLLGVDVMTGHFEFTYQDHEVLENIAEFNGEFLAHNVKVNEDALFDGAAAYDEDEGYAFKPYSIKEMGEHRVAIIGQAFPYTPIANPSRFIPDWTFGIQAQELQELVDKIRGSEQPDAVILLSHNGMDVDLKLAATVTGLDVILGGHTHDGVPKPIHVANATGKTLVTNAGSNGKYLAVLDLELGKGHVKDYRYTLLPVFSNFISPDAEMASFIDDVRAPYQSILTEKLAVSEDLLYRRGNFNGTFDQVICDALRKINGADISLSPGFRWGTTVLPGQDITMEHVMDQTSITYPETYTREMTGEQIKAILEDVSDNIFNLDPFYRQGGDMVRVGGMDYTIDPMGQFGQRISEMRLDDGTKIEARKTYKVAGWATVNSPATGDPIWDVVAEYLRDKKQFSIEKMNLPKLINMAGNKGIIN
ncbi:MAG: thiosulfohydrolase SoxB [Methylophaga sp.]|nr:MAG: thiosulfohydrolase SoxB [Methylophaga sp.]